MIAIPQMDEQAITARQIERLGLGRAFLDRGATTSDSLREAIVSLLEEPSYRMTVDEFSKDMKTLGGAQASAAAILDFLNAR
jgi:UDP:flavonoid glycosyltransferase YjiC (YdhE family)